MSDDPSPSCASSSSTPATAARIAVRSTRSTPRLPRPGGWLTCVAVLVALPASASAAGIIEFGTSATLPDGSTYSVGQITDSRAATDPSLGRTCDTAEVRDRAGKLVSRQMACRPRTRP